MYRDSLVNNLHCQQRKCNIIVLWVWIQNLKGVLFTICKVEHNISKVSKVVTYCHSFVINSLRCLQFMQRNCHCPKS